MENWVPSTSKKFIARLGNMNLNFYARCLLASVCHLRFLHQFGSKRAEILHTDSLNKCTRVCQWARWCMFGCLPRLTQLGTTISQPQTKFLKSLLCNFLALLWVAFTQHFSPLASKLRRGFMWQKHNTCMGDGWLFKFLTLPLLACFR